jgi:hypothetical protein
MWMTGGGGSLFCSAVRDGTFPIMYIPDNETIAKVEEERL